MAEKIIITSEEDPRRIYKLLIGCIGPRPIGWISTISKEAVPNLAPYSFFTMFGMNPAVIGFSASIRRDASMKDSFLNAKETSCFVHNVVSEDLVVPMNASSEEFPHGVSEFAKVGLTASASKMVAAPRVKEAAINLECRVIKIVSLGDLPGNGQVVFGEVVAIHINREDLFSSDGLLDSSKLSLVSRLGRSEYMSFGKIFDIARP